MEETRELTDEEIEKIDNILKENKESPDRLIKILQDVQGKLEYVPREAQKIVANRLKIPVSRVYGIVSFYNFFRLFPPGRHGINICLGTACYVKGGKEILDKTAVAYGIQSGQTTSDRKFSLEVIRCLGCCALAPVISVDGTVYGRNNSTKLKEILNTYK